MTELIATVLGYRIILRITCIIIGIAAAAYILYRHRPISARGRIIEDATKEPEKLNPPKAKQQTNCEFAIGLQSCSCGGKPIYVEGYDTLSVQCPRCGRHTETIYGDYYDEAFMLDTYKEQAADMWNRLCEKAE